MADPCGHDHRAYEIAARLCEAGSVAALDDAEVEEALDWAAARRRFRASTRTIELERLCTSCFVHE